MSVLRFSLLLPMTLLLACSAPAPKEAPAVDPPAASEEADYGESPKEHMREHFVDATGIHEAVVRGDVEALRAAASRLANHAPLPTLGKDAESAVMSVRTAAAQARDAVTLSEAAKAVGTLGAVCGDCHASISVSPEFLDATKPTEDSSVQGHMARHAWAVNRAWEGLVAGNAKRWERGLNMLAEPPLPRSAFGPEPPMAAMASSNRVHELAVAGLTAADATSRGEVYGQLVAACSTCHTALGQAPGAGVYTREQK